MVKGDDAIRKKRNKASRKKLNKDSSTVSARIAGIIAAKKRRKYGNRRMCEGMCFSLPTPEDPFNDTLGKKNLKKKRQADDAIAKGKISGKRKETEIESGQEQKKPKNHEREKQNLESRLCPSKFMSKCLNTIQDGLQIEGTLNTIECKPFFGNTWAVEFLKCYTRGKDILDTSGSCANVDQIAWIVSTAADAFTGQEEEGVSISSPFLLYLVSSQEKASKVRLICKHLKALGIHTVSLHPGASVDHQIHGLKTCEPEFVVSTPERLLELVSLKAIDISSVSFMVVDGLEAICKAGHLDATTSIRKTISGNPLTMVFNDYLNDSPALGLQNFLTEPISRLSPNDSITCQSAYIIQSVHVCVDEEQKLLKGIEIMHQACGIESGLQLVKVLYVVSENSKIKKLVSTLRSSGYSASKDSTVSSKIKDNGKRKSKPLVSVIDIDNMSSINVGEYGIVIYIDVTCSVENYIQILTSMARHTINGVLHTMLNEKDASLAGPLIKVVEQCGGQSVPQALKKLSTRSSTMLQN